MSNDIDLTKHERAQISEILGRRANEIAGFSSEYCNDPKHYGSVEFALSREIERLCRLAGRVNPYDPDEGEEP